MITFGITVADEFFEFKRLINSLQPYVLPSEEIVILADASKVTQEIIEYAARCGLKVNTFFFKNNFADFKNELFTHATKPFLFQIDADEQIPVSLLESVRSNLSADPNAFDLLWVPRINVVRGASEDDVKEFGWVINERGWEGFPDYQARVMSTKGHIRWKGEVHEIPHGAEKVAQMPAHPVYSILHVKEIEKQRKQNELYESI